MKEKKYCKGRDHCHCTGEHRVAAQSICNLKYSVPKQKSYSFPNESCYNYHFIIYIYNLCSSKRKRSYKNWKKCRKKYGKYIVHVIIYW